MIMFIVELLQTSWFCDVQCALCSYFVLYNMTEKSGNHLKLNEILSITYWWSRKTTVNTVIHETGHSSKSIVDWYNLHRDVCAQYFIDHPVQIGGPGKVVEIDESKLSTTEGGIKMGIGYLEGWREGQGMPLWLRYPTVRLKLSFQLFSNMFILVPLYYLMSGEHTQEFQLLV